MTGHGRGSSASGDELTGERYPRTLCGMWDTGKLISLSERENESSNFGLKP
jgi:hypothetical protein